MKQWRDCLQENQSTTVSPLFCKHPQMYNRPVMLIKKTGEHLSIIQTYENFDQYRIADDKKIYKFFQVDEVQFSSFEPLDYEIRLLHFLAASERGSWILDHSLNTQLVACPFLEPRIHEIRLNLYTYMEPKRYTELVLKFA